MPQSKVVIVYSPNQARARTVIIPHDDSQVPIHAANIARGEAVVVVSLGLLRQIGHEAALGQVLGRPAQSDHCAVVDAAGVVRKFVCADPAIDRHPEGTLHADPGHTLSIGDGLWHQRYIPTAK